MNLKKVIKLRSSREWFSTLPVFLLLLSVIIAGNGEIVVHNSRAEVRKRPASRGSAADRLENRGEIEPRFVSVQQRLTDTDHVRGDQDLIDHIGVLGII